MVKSGREDIHDLRSVETEFPAIAFNDEVSSEKPLSYEPTVSSLNDEIDFRISFDDSDDEDYTEKSICINPSPEPIVSCFDDLDFFNDFENEFPAIVYNDAQTSKSDLLTEPIFSPQHIDELDDETSFFKYNKEEQNVLYFNDLFPFNIIHPNDLKSEKYNDDNEVDIIQSSEGNEITQGSNILSETSHDKITKTFIMGSFVMNLKVNIVIWNYYGMLFYLIMNLYVSFGILFDPKWYYKDEFYKEVAEANGDYTLALFKLGKLVCKNGYGVLVLENMDAYRDEGMGDVIFGEPFLREVRIKTRRFEWMITIYNGDDEVNEEDKMNGISHPFQKLKGFYKGVLNLGPDYIRDAKMEEWLTRGHISMHEME
ncbi:hypothetical protein Tco_1525171 [Tanacetum coccineum]